MTGPRPAARGRLTVALVAVVVLAGLGAGVAFLVRRAAEQVAGHIHADGTPAGTFDFVVDDCASGHAFVPGFFGADLRGAGRYDLRVVDSGEDAQLWLYPPGAKRGAFPIGKSDCQRWDVLVDWAHVTVNRVHTVSGHVHVTCEAHGRLTADVDFTRCAF